MENAKLEDGFMDAEGNPTPQLEDGFTRIANEIIMEIITRPFSGSQMRFLLTLWRLSWGCQKKSATFEFWTDFEVCGIKKQNIKLMLDKLETAKVILIDPVTKTIWFNKDFRQWIIKPSPFSDSERIKKLVMSNLSSNIEITTVMYRLPNADQKVISTLLGSNIHITESNIHITESNIHITPTPPKVADSQGLEPPKERKKERKERKTGIIPLTGRIPESQIEDIHKVADQINSVYECVCLWSSDDILLHNLLIDYSEEELCTLAAEAKSLGENDFFGWVAKGNRNGKSNA